MSLTGRPDHARLTRPTAFPPCMVERAMAERDTVHMFDRDRPPAVRL
jgi:hypothetical protein